MKNFTRSFFIFLVSACACLSQCVNAAILTEPFAPRPGEAVKVTIAGYCLSIDRWEQLGTRVIFYGEDSQVEILGCKDYYQTSIANLAGPVTQIEVWGRLVGPPHPPDGYMLIDIRGVKVDAVSARSDAPTKIRVTSGIAQALSRSTALAGTIGVVQAQDASGLPFDYARVTLEPKSMRGPTSLPLTRNQPSYTNSAGEIKFSTNQAMEVAYQPGDYVTYVFTLKDVLVPKPTPAFATIGVVSPQFAPYALPLVEYQALVQTGFAFFLASDVATMQSLDSVQSSFQRTYAVFTGLTQNAPGAVPVCRFFSDGQNGRPLTHWFTADAVECAAKRGDPNWIYEGTPFWTFAARAEGYCPPSTRAVTRLLYANVAKPVSAIARYTQYLDIKNASLAASPTASGFRWIDDGVAFCAPE